MTHHNGQEQSTTQLGSTFVFECHVHMWCLRCCGVFFLCFFLLATPPSHPRQTAHPLSPESSVRCSLEHEEVREVVTAPGLRPARVELERPLAALERVAGEAVPRDRHGPPAVVAGLALLPLMEPHVVPGARLDQVGPGVVPGARRPVHAARVPPLAREHLLVVPEVLRRLAGGRVVEVLVRPVRAGRVHVGRVVPAPGVAHRVEEVPVARHVEPLEEPVHADARLRVGPAVGPPDHRVRAKHRVQRVDPGLPERARVAVGVEEAVVVPAGQHLVVVPAHGRVRLPVVERAGPLLGDRPPAAVGHHVAVDLEREHVVARLHPVRAVGRRRRGELDRAAREPRRRRGPAVAKRRRLGARLLGRPAVDLDLADREQPGRAGELEVDVAPDGPGRAGDGVDRVRGHPAHPRAEGAGARPGAGRGALLGRDAHLEPLVRTGVERGGVRRRAAQPEHVPAGARAGPEEEHHPGHVDLRRHLERVHRPGLAVAGAVEERSSLVGRAVVGVLDVVGPGVDRRGGAVGHPDRVRHQREVGRRVDRPPVRVGQPGGVVVDELFKVRHQRGARRHRGAVVGAVAVRHSPGGAPHPDDVGLVGRLERRRHRHPVHAGRPLPRTVDLGAAERDVGHRAPVAAERDPGGDAGHRGEAALGEVDRPHVRALLLDPRGGDPGGRGVARRDDGLAVGGGGPPRGAERLVVRRLPGGADAVVELLVDKLEPAGAAGVARRGGADVLRRRALERREPGEHGRHLRRQRRQRPRVRRERQPLVAEGAGVRRDGRPLRGDRRRDLRVRGGDHAAERGAGGVDRRGDGGRALRRDLVDLRDHPADGGRGPARRVEDDVAHLGVEHHVAVDRLDLRRGLAEGAADHRQQPERDTARHRAV
eukprot:m.229174 g.229174  ORF g.229174 m.229174 type:complete len:878 (+) comp25994_c1_seq1:992-3625(+)